MTTRAPLFRWKDCEVGRQGLCLILRYALTKATADQLLTASPGDFGVNGEEMRAWVLQRLPELEQVHLAQTNAPLTSKKMMGRLYNMYDVLPGGGRALSSEHPTKHEDLMMTWNQLDLFKQPEPA
jgi:hypothetical protein